MTNELGPDCASVTAANRSTQILKQGSAVLLLIAAVAGRAHSTGSAIIALLPPTATLTASQSTRFAPLDASQSVKWSLSPAIGTLSTTGLYTAPAYISDSQIITVSATGRAVSVATVSLRPSVTIALTTASRSLSSGQAAAFLASVGGTTNTTVTWSLWPNIGSLTKAGQTAMYVAPILLSAPQVITITATSAVDSRASASVQVSLIPLITVALLPTAVILQPGGTQQYSASVLGTASGAVTWSIYPALGSINQFGLYFAPSNTTSTQAVTVTGKSVTDPTRSGTAIITLQPAPQALSFTNDAYRLTSLSYMGQSYVQYVSRLVAGAIFQMPNGSLADGGWSNPAVTQPSPTSAQQVFNAGGAYPFTVKVTWSAADSRTVKAVASITNNDPVNILNTVGLHMLALNLPGAPVMSLPVNQPIHNNQYNGEVVTLFHGAWGSVATWLSGYPLVSDIGSIYYGPSQTNFDNAITTTTNNGPNSYKLALAPGQTQTVTQYLRFGSSTDTAVALVPEAYAEYRAVFPDLVNWPDRRPIGFWMIADAYNGRSALNPRGYLWDKTLDVSKASNFNSRVLASTDATIAVMNKVSPKPQGLIIWDLEGQEFDQPFTYVGYPNQLPSIAPEMDGIADQLMAKLKAAGYRVGVTIRPTTFLSGATLPATCFPTIQNSGLTNYDLADKFIKTDAVYPYRGYACNGNTWFLSSAHQPTVQTSSQNYTQVLGLLRQKITYAKTRWGATLFYIDSDVWEGGTVLEPSIFRQLATEFPDCLMIPETAGTYQFGATSPYEPASRGYYGTSSARRDLYPNAFGVINVANADTQSHWSQLVQAVASGDILMFTAGFYAPELPAVQQLYAAAKSVTP